MNGTAAFDMILEKYIYIVDHKPQIDTSKAYMDKKPHLSDDLPSMIEWQLVYA